MKKIIGHIAVAILLLAIVHPAKAAMPVVDTLSVEAREAITAEFVAKIDSLDQESFARWLYERGRQAESRNLFEAKIFYDTYLNSLIGSTVIEYSIPTTYDRKSFWQMITANIKNIQRFAMRYVERYPIFGRTIYNYELFSKSLQLRSSRTIEKKLTRIGNPQLTDLWNKVKKDRESLEITEAFIRKSQPEIDAIRMSALPADTAKVYEFESLKTMRDRMDVVVRVAEVKVMSEIYNRDTTGVSAEMSFNWKVVRNRLDGDHAIVEYMTCPDEKGDISYYAVVLTDNMNDPAIVSIAQEGRIHDCLKDGIDYEVLYKTLWTPVEPLLENKTEIYVVPTGMIHRVPFAGLHDKRGYLCDRYRVHHLLSGRDIVLNTSEDIPFVGKTALLVGGADYDIALNGIADTTDTFVRQEKTAFHDALRSVRGQGFGYLPGSLAETNAISEQLSAAGWNVRMLSDVSATETSLRNAVALWTADIMHISTHGFHIPSPVSDDDSNRNIFRVSDNPLMRSGLAFSGANVHWNEDYDTEIPDDGILTALELSRLDLTSTRLVVLSACNTALGETDPAEGVFGLQRAIRLAGAGAMIVSLWEVPDKETVAFMQSFYAHLLEGHTLKEAFDATQKKARLENPDSPQIWAGFVMIE